MQRKIQCRKFPSPHSGILFLCENRRVPPGGKTGRVSVPSFGDSFFIAVCFFKRPQYKVSVPSFGDSFFIMESYEDAIQFGRRFPSPHSGILFL